MKLPAILQAEAPIRHKKFKTGVLAIITCYAMLIAPMLSERITPEMVQDGLWTLMVISMAALGFEGGVDAVRERWGVPGNGKHPEPPA